MSGIGAATMAGVLGAIAHGQASAQELPHLDETDPTGQALGYREDAARVDAVKFPQRQASQHCSNCNFFQTKGAGFGPCQLFAGKSVSAKGWCSAYAAKAG